MDLFMVKTVYRSLVIIELSQHKKTILALASFFSKSIISRILAVVLHFVPRSFATVDM